MNTGGADPAGGETFAVAGASVWARRAREELAATGARRHGPSVAAPSIELTHQELRVARLVAEGHSNREVAGILYLSTKTVEAHLRQVFRTLDVRSRGELAARAARTRLDER